MNRQTAAAFFAGALLLACATASALPQRAGLSASEEGALKAAIAAPSRSPANAARDRYRHPLQTFSFFGVRRSDTVVEIWPFGGWYTEIFGALSRRWRRPLLRRLDRGERQCRRTADDGRRSGALRPHRARRLSRLGAAEHRVPDGTADVVLTFRNIHNWQAAISTTASLIPRRPSARCSAMLRPGGTLGIEEHRLPESADPAREGRSGYVKVSTVRRLAEAAGFRFVAASEINANPRDTTDYPQGVWTLPADLRARRPGPRPLRRDRRERPDDVALRETCPQPPPTLSARRWNSAS